MTSVEWLVETWDKNQRLLSPKQIIEQAKEMEERQTEQIAVEFAEWVLTNEHIDTIWSTPKKQLFQEFLKTKSNDKTTN